MTTVALDRPAARRGVDPRGPRFAASVTSAVLIVALLLPSPTAAGIVLGAQAVVFAVGALLGLGRAPYGIAFRRLVRPRLAPPVELEAEAPVRFAQALGLLFALVAAAGFLAGVPLVGYVAAGLCLVAAALNAVLGLCLGCEVYLAALRATHR